MSAIVPYQQRAVALNLIFNPHSMAFFPFDSIRDGHRILFAGCGNGKLVVEIALELQKRRLKVEIVAFDFSERQLEQAKEAARKAGIAWIQWELQDAHDLEKYREQFDFVHARFLLNYAENAELITRMLCRVLADKGIFIGEEFSGIEVDLSSNVPEHVEALRQWVRIVRLQHLVQKSDMTFAKRLPDLLKQNDMLVTKEHQPHPKAALTQEKSIFPASMDDAHLLLPDAEHHQIDRTRLLLEEVRDLEGCSLTFKNFKQIQAKKSFI